MAIGSQVLRSRPLSRPLMTRVALGCNPFGCNRESSFRPLFSPFFQEISIFLDFAESDDPRELAIFARNEANSMPGIPKYKWIARWSALLAIG
jgi:hypothetical protein